jgi:hypothetical protein
MNLQIRALQTFMRNGNPYDDNHPVVKNVVFDVDRLAYSLDEKIYRMHQRMVCVRRDLTRMHDFSSIPTNFSWRYEKVLDDVSDFLFDVLTYDRISNHRQMAWKEYFHGLYELVVSPDNTDRTHSMQMVQETIKYFNVLKKPNALPEDDPLFTDIRTCRDLFRRLQIEHEKLKIPDFYKKINKHLKLHTHKRVQYMDMEKKIRSLLNLRNECTEMLRWSVH